MSGPRVDVLQDVGVDALQVSEVEIATGQARVHFQLPDTGSGHTAFKVGQLRRISKAGQIRKNLSGLIV